MEPLQQHDSASQVTGLPSALASDLQAVARMDDLQAVYGRGQEQLRQMERLLSTRQPSASPDLSNLPKEEQQPDANRGRWSIVGESDDWGFQERLMHTQRRADDRRRSLESWTGTGRSSIDKGTRRSLEVSTYLTARRAPAEYNRVSPPTNPGF